MLGSVMIWVLGGIALVGLIAGIILIIVGAGARRRPGALPGAGTAPLIRGIASLVLLTLVPGVLLVIQLASGDGGRPSAASGTSAPVSGAADISVPNGNMVTPTAPQREARTWRGTYTCGQGLTGLEVTLRPVGQGQLVGTLSFFPVSGNSNAASGCYNITARADRATQRLTTRAGSWIQQPPGYSTVDLDGIISDNGMWLGQVMSSACTSFELRPAQPQASCAAGTAGPAL